jgi:hypothetical protein
MKMLTAREMGLGICVINSRFLPSPQWLQTLQFTVSKKSQIILPSSGFVMI